VLEIDSPGGGVTESDEIYHRVMQFKKNRPGVPVVVTMSQPALPAELTAPAYDMYLVMLNEQNEETAVQRVSVPVEGQRFARTMMLRVRPERHVLSLAVSNPASDETSFLQREIDATACR